MITGSEFHKKLDRTVCFDLFEFDTRGIDPVMWRDLYKEVHEIDRAADALCRAIKRYYQRKDELQDLYAETAVSSDDLRREFGTYHGRP